MKNGGNVLRYTLFLFGLLDKFLDFSREYLVPTTRFRRRDLQGNRVKSLVVSGSVTLEQRLDLGGCGHGKLLKSRDFVPCALCSGRPSLARGSPSAFEINRENAAHANKSVPVV